MKVTYQYGQRGTMPPVGRTSYQGTYNPQILKEAGVPQWNSGVLFVGDKGMLLSDYGKTNSAAGSRVRGFQAARTVHPEVTRSLRRVDSRLQDWRAHDLQLRICGLVDRSEPSRQRRFQGGQEARVGLQEPPRDERARDRAADPPQVSQRLEADLNTADE
jgi:hypothetical protein